MEVYAYNPSTWEEVAERWGSSRLAWAIRDSQKQNKLKAQNHRVTALLFLGMILVGRDKNSFLKVGSGGTRL